MVLDDAHPVYEGTGLRAGDSIPELVGYEYDRTTGAQTPSPVEVIARSPLIDAEGRPGLSEATVYRTSGGALVFGAGTIFWSKALDGRQRDARVERMTANVLRLALDLPVPPALASVTAPAAAAPMGQWAAAVRTLASGMPGPAGVAQLPDGTFMIADARANRIWQADGSGKFWPYAGDGHPSPSSFFDNVPGLSARFFGPTAVLPDAAGNVYVADTHNTAIRKIANDPARTVTTFAGALMRAGNADGVGAAARFGSPMGMAWLDGAHIVIADAANMSIRVLDVNSRAVTTLATAHSFEETDGPAARATLYSPTAVAVGPDGRVYFVASQTGTVKMIAPDGSRTITTLVAGGHGFADGPGTEARLEPQMGLAWFNGGLIVSDPGNARLRWVSPGGSAATTSVRTWAGSGASVTADGDGASASFQLPLGLWRGQDGKVYVVDGAAGALRVVDP